MRNETSGAHCACDVGSLQVSFLARIRPHADAGGCIGPLLGCPMTSPDQIDAKRDEIRGKAQSLFLLHQDYEALEQEAPQLDVRLKLEALCNRAMLEVDYQLFTEVMDLLVRARFSKEFRGFEIHLRLHDIQAAQARRELEKHTLGVYNQAPQPPPLPTKEAKQ
jgi:hypothetical protein